MRKNSSEVSKLATVTNKDNRSLMIETRDAKMKFEMKKHE